ncbi:GNAT family N-acetyltransferase [Plantactinospora sp. CA-290183]|uniref:GNAT family N-acetyltransferase n=1 Tax=Plantactinospora sp. CA-290183 TaxID=3240006 RepID=UPI003D93C95E
MIYHIRRVAAGEWRQLSAIRLEALQDSPPTAFSTPPAEATAFSDTVWQQEAAREADSASSATFVATGEAGDWVGMAAAAPLADVPDHAHVYAVYVTPAHRGPAGPAAALMAAAIRFARDRRSPQARVRRDRQGDPVCPEPVPEGAHHGLPGFPQRAGMTESITGGGSSARRRPRP